MLSINNLLLFQRHHRQTRVQGVTIPRKHQPTSNAYITCKQDPNSVAANPIRLTFMALLRKSDLRLLDHGFNYYLFSRSLQYEHSYNVFNDSRGQTVDISFSCR